MQILNAENIPPDVPLSKLAALTEYADDLVNNAVDALLPKVREFYPNDEKSAAHYRNGLELCRALTPQAVGLLAEQLLEDMHELLPPEHRDLFSQVLTNLYLAALPMPKEFQDIPLLHEHIGVWMGVADVAQFVEIFHTIPFPQDDPRGISECVLESLNSYEFADVFDNCLISLVSAEDAGVERVEIFVVPPAQRPQLYGKLHNQDNNLH